MVPVKTEGEADAEAEAEVERSGVRNAGATPALRTPEDHAENEAEAEAEAKARDRAADEAEAKAEAKAEDEDEAPDEAEDDAEAPDEDEAEAPGEELVAAASAPRRRVSRSRAAGPWLRVRSALTLLIVVAFTGVVLAVAVGTALTLAARALRKAVG